MEWNTNIDEAPRGAEVWETRTDKNGKESKVRVFTPDLLILTTKCGQVIGSRWMPEHIVGKYPPRTIQGRWFGLAEGEEPVAWMLWPTPYEAE